MNSEMQMQSLSDVVLTGRNQDEPINVMRFRGFTSQLANMYAKKK